MLYTSLKLLKQHHACANRYHHLAQALGGVKHYGLDTPIPLSRILKNNGLEDTLWALRATTVPCDRETRLLVCCYAEHILPLFESKYPLDKRPHQAVETSRRFANGLAKLGKLVTAYAAAASVARDAGDAERDWQQAKLVEMLGQ